MSSVVQWLDQFWREDSHSASTAPPPGQRAGAVQQVDDVAPQEVEVSGVWGRVVAEGVSQTAFLQKNRAEAWRQTNRCAFNELFMKSYGASGLVIPPADVGGTLFLGESRGGLRGGTPASCFCMGWGKGYVPAGKAGEGTREGLWGRSLSQRRCCEFCRSPPTGWGSRTTLPRCSTDRPLPALWNAPPCHRSCKIKRCENREGYEGRYARSFLLQHQRKRESCVFLHSSRSFLCSGVRADATSTSTSARVGISKIIPGGHRSYV